MKIVLVAGLARKVGKTSVAAGLIRSLRLLDWAAVKVSTHPPGATHGPLAGTGAFELEEESAASSLTDTGRFLTAGARRAFWLQTTPEALPSGLAELRDKLGGTGHLLIESGSAAGWVRPCVRIVVLSPARPTTKWKARSLLARADAVVKMGEKPAARCATSGRTFYMAGRRQVPLALTRFVRSALRRMADSQLGTAIGDVACHQ